ncbi:DUF192 domain-containing protein [Acuticoccus sp. MNP-M23]|uniref:DUF192 domain-containing protein n=1 Tax=Acuticoccus sp. MNP-M23 TaxID=3072793 RepID=UPI002815A6C5|nr:DUF192 domain-containing protein [Acuticoccus sp. MNP-M23]WMS41597.1 DUF192 domain-containing protein [Acuticoccus sp. MNP-M23]
MSSRNQSPQIAAAGLPITARPAGALPAKTLAASTIDSPAGAPVATPARANEARLVAASGVHDFTIEIADDPLERAQGLMYRQEMARDHGMLFDFGKEAPRSFWMKNTPLPLDIIFIKGDGTVVSIAANTTPFSTDPVPSEGPARFVFEVNGGVAAAIGLAPGDRLLHQRVED